MSKPEEAVECTMPARDRSRHFAAFLLILFLGVVLRLYHFNSPPVDFLSWRDTQTLMVARNFFREGMNLFSPSVDWRTTTEVATKGTVGGTELQVTPYLTAALYFVFGIHFWVGRVVPLFFALVGTCYFYALARRFIKPSAALIATLLLTVSPYFLFCGRVQMPESFAYAMAFAALYYFDLLMGRMGRIGPMRQQNGTVFALAVVTSALAIVGKPPLMIIAIPMLFLVLQRHGLRAFRQPALYAFALLVAAPVGLYTGYSFSLIHKTGIAFLQPSLLNYGHYLKDPDYYWTVGKAAFFNAVTPPVAILAAIGLFVGPISKSDRGHFFPHAWLVGALASFLLVPGGNSVNGYYHMILAPPAVLLAAIPLDLLLKRRKQNNFDYEHEHEHERKTWVISMLLGIAVLLLAASWSLYYVKLLYEPRYVSAYHCGEWIRENTPPDARVLTASPNPATLYFADRIGWTSWSEYYGKGAQFGHDLINKVLPLGATVLAIDDEQFDDAYSGQFNAIRDDLYNTFTSYHGDDFVVFRMDRPADLALPPDRTLVFGLYITRKYLRGSWAANQDDAAKEQCVALGPNPEASIVFTTPEPPRVIYLDIAAAVTDQQISIAINGEAGNAVQIPEALKKGRIMIQPKSPPPKDGRWTLTLAATRQNKLHASLLLYKLEIE